ncbi:hypothetical protein CsSME_00021277 [Camellia sinensis var. sinensis]
MEYMAVDVDGSASGLLCTWNPEIFSLKECCCSRSFIILAGLNLIGGLAKDTTLDQFTKYFGKYVEITDLVIMKDRHTGRPRGFGFVTYADPSVVDTVIVETHVINDKQVEIKRTISKGSAESMDFKTKKIFVGGIPTSVTEDEFKNFFSKYGKVVEHEIIRDHVTKRSWGFGFVVFDNEQVVDTILANGNMIDMEGSQMREQKWAALLKEKRASSGLTSPPRVIGKLWFLQLRDMQLFLMTTQVFFPQSSLSSLLVFK